MSTSTYNGEEGVDMNSWHFFMCCSKGGEGKNKENNLNLWW